MKILVTGAAGFIGSHLTEKLLSLGHTVIGIDNFDPFYDRKIKERNISTAKSHPQFKLIEADILDIASQVNAIGEIDVVYHLAAKAGVQPSLKDPAGYMRTNVQGTMAILEWMRQSGCKNLIFASSSSVYGNTNKIPFLESDVCNKPVSPYAFSKLSAELLNFNYHHLFGFSIVNLRFFTVYGPRQRPDLAIHKFVKKLINSQPIDMYGNGETARDYTFVEDTVNGLLNSLDYILANPGVFEIINLGNNQPVSLADMISSIEKVVGEKFEINKMDKQPGDVDITYASVEKAKKLLRYNPSIQFEDGLAIFLQWLRKEQASPVNHS